MKKTLTIAVISSMLLTGCAGIMSGGEDRLTIATSTSDAKIYVDGRYLGDGRISTSINRGEPAELRIEKEGCATVYATTGDKLDGWVFANILIDFGVVSIPIDLITGNAWKLDQSEYLLVPECNA